MNPRKLLALALVMILAVISTGILAYAQNADGEPTPSGSPALTESNTPESSAATTGDAGASPSPAAAATESAAPTGDAGASPSPAAAATESAAPTGDAGASPSPAAAATESAAPTAEVSASPSAEAAPTADATPTAEATAESEQTEQPDASPDSTTETTQEPSAPDNTETAGPIETDAGVPTNTPEAQEPTLYDKLIAAESCESIFTLLNENFEAAYGLSAEQLVELYEKADAMEDDGFKTDVQETLEYLFYAADNGEGIELYKGQQSGVDRTLSMSNYNKDSAVYYMVAKSNESSPYDEQNVIKSVKLNNTNVKNHPRTSFWSGGEKLSVYYKGIDSRSSNTTGTLSIVPAEGYYVTRVVVACCGSGNQSPFDCETWSQGNAFDKTFSITSDGTLTTDLDSIAFGHSSRSSAYFILICVAPTPTPLYVQYEYGDIKTLLGEENFATSVFANADDWTDASTNNVYKPSGDSSDGRVVTNDTQFKYTYAEAGTDAEKAEAVANWSHTTNTITPAAAEAAAAIGYKFAGWQYTYYNTVTATQNASGSYNNYTYDFSDEYGRGNVGESTALTLTTNVRLVAQWEEILAEEIAPDPAFIYVTKTFKGITKEQIPNNFTIYVGTIENQIDINDVKEVADGLEVTWKIPVEAASSYKVKEANADVEGYNLFAEPEGILSENGVKVDVKASNVTVTELDPINSCSNTVFNLRNDTVFIVAAHSNVIVLSAAPLGATARAAIIEKIKTFSNDFKHTDGETVFFYQISKYKGQKISIGGTNITLSADGMKATIGATREWTKVKWCSYTYDKAQTDISITNTYSLKTCSLSISKSVEGNIGDRSEEFRFTVTLGEGYSFDGAKYSIDGAEAQSVTATDNTFSFNLKHGQTITFSGLPVGAGLTVEEAESGYVTTVDGVNGNSKVITLAETNNTITFVNVKNITIETGVLLDSLPYILILAVVLGVGVIVFIRKRHEHD